MTDWDSADTECDNCGGNVEREVDDHSLDCGTSYAPINGSSCEVDRVSPRWLSSWYCKGCTQARLGELADYGVNTYPMPPPRDQRDWRYHFEIERPNFRRLFTEIGIPYAG